MMALRLESTVLKYQRYTRLSLYLTEAPSVRSSLVGSIEWVTLRQDHISAVIPFPSGALTGHPLATR